MNLYFHGNFPLNMKITNELGQVLYKVETPPWRPSESRIATIHRIVPNGSLTADNSEDMQDRFVELGRIKFNILQPSVLCYGLQEVSIKDFFQSNGASLLGYGRHKAWTANDGVQYTWKMGIRTPTLYDAAKNPVVIYHLPFMSGALQRDPQVFLEVKPSVVHIIDQIVFTFVYVEKWRQDSE